MFDIGFTELLLIGLVALVVIGPEKLPRVARTLGHLAGKLQRYVSDVKSDINREIELEDLRKMRDSLQASATSFESSVQTELNKTESELNKTVEAVTQHQPDSTQFLESKPAEDAPSENKPVEAKTG